MATTPRLITADDVCLAVRATLDANLPAWAAALGLPPGPRRWLQLPEQGAAPAEPTPYGVITTPGLTGSPTRRSSSYDATWRVAVGILDRGATHDATAARARGWAAAIRGAVLAGRGLGALEATVTWLSEDYSARPAADAARTLGGCGVGFDIAVPDVLPLRPPGDPAELPLVITTDLTLTAIPPTERPL